MADEPMFDLRRTLRGKQKSLLESHESLRFMTQHGPTLGRGDEDGWAAILRGFLPERYAVGPVFAIDHRGHRSDQIDIAVFDRYYSPLWFGEKGGALFVPAESIYAVFEVKAELDKASLQYACVKVASVRSLVRTSANFAVATGRVSVGINDRPILGGVLAARSGWVIEGARSALLSHLPGLGQPDTINIGIALDTFAFDFTPVAMDAMESQTLDTADFAFHTRDVLIRFAARLFRQLQSIGNPPGLDMAAYERALD